MSDDKPFNLDYRSPHLRREIYRDKAGEWRWRIFAGNNREIACSGEGYVNRGDCADGLTAFEGGNADSG